MAARGRRDDRAFDHTGLVKNLACSVLFLEALNERISSTFRATVISMANLGIRTSFCLLGPLVGHGIDSWGLASVLSALAVLFSIAFVFLLLPLVLRAPGHTTQRARRADLRR